MMQSMNLYEKTDRGWNIVEDRQLDPSGLLPLGVAENYVEETSQDFNNIEGKALEPVDIPACFYSKK